MDSDNLALVVGTYADAGAAAEDFATLKSAQDAGEYQVVGAVVMNRDASGKIDVSEHGDKNVGGGATAGGAVGLVVGLFAPPLLAATAIGAGIGAGIGALKKRHEEKQLGVDVDEYLPLSGRSLGAPGRRRRRWLRKWRIGGDLSVSGKHSLSCGGGTQRRCGRDARVRSQAGA
jgi:Glycine zipper